MSDDASDIVRRFWDAHLHNAPDDLDGLVAQDVVVHDARERQVGLDAIKRKLVAFQSAMSGMAFRVEKRIVTGDHVVLRWRVEGTHTGDFRGVPPRGGRLQFSATSIYRVEDGKVREIWVNRDDLAIAEFLAGARDVGEPDRARA